MKSVEEMHGFLADTIPSALEHTGVRSFDAHLLGVHRILQDWGADEHLQMAGLFHSIYGTEGFQGFCLPWSRRVDIASLTSGRAERLAWIFCVVDRKSVDDSMDQYSQFDPNETGVTYEFTARVELGRFPIVLTGQGEWLDYLELNLADQLEQVEGSASKPNPHYGWEVGGAWGYRREAFQKMVAILSRLRAPRLTGVAEAHYDAVYGKEDISTRHIHQPITPPIGDLAKEARGHYAATGEIKPTLCQGEAWESQYFVYSKL